MTHEVVLMEELSTFGRFRDQALCLADVRDNDMAHVGVQLLSGKL